MDTSSPVIASWVTLGTVIAGLIFQFIRAERQRKWEVQDRILLANKVEVEAAKVLTRANSIVEDVKAEAVNVKKQNTQILDAINENTVVSTEARDQAAEAQRVANHVNDKIESLGISHNKLERDQTKLDKQIHESKKGK